jgi:hypothetical protein
MRNPAIAEVDGVGMHTLVVFFSILGGIGYFGILGMFIGPLVFAMGIAFLEFYVESTPASERIVVLSTMGAIGRWEPGTGTSHNPGIMLNGVEDRRE